MDYHSKNHSKYKLLAHLVLSCKYRLNLLSYSCIKREILKSLKRCETKDFSIVVMESDCNHIHIMIDYDPKVSILQIVRRLKQISTHDIWLKYDLSKFLWKEKTFWSDGYFACSIGDASAETIRRYIEQQG
ncbi:MAG: IS200/IS605 family transposase [Prevotella sp.]